MKTFTFRCLIAKKITGHVQCDSFRASLCVVRDLTIIDGLLILILFVALWVDDMVLNFCVLLEKDEPPAV
jgi:hypothetical protein